MTDRMKPIIVAPRGRGLGNWSTLSITNVGRDLVALGPEVDAQHLSNPHTVIGDDGLPITLAYGSTNDSPQLIGDRTYAIHDGKANMVMNFPPHEPQCIDYLGVSVGVAKTEAATSLGYRYFAIGPAGDAEKHQAWITWAVSKDGLSWEFVDATGTRLTKDPRQSLHLIARRDLIDNVPGRTDNQPHYWHPAMFYNHEDGYFEVVLGYAGVVGIGATWWAIQFNTADPFGLGQIWRRQGLPTPYIISDGVIPDDDSWMVSAQNPAGSVDPMDLVPLYNADGSLDSVLYLYEPLASAFKWPTTVAYNKMDTRGTTGPTQYLDTTPVFGARWAACSDAPAGTFVGAYQVAPGSSSLKGYISVTPSPCKNAGYGSDRQGLLPIELTLS